MVIADACPVPGTAIAREREPSPPDSVYFRVVRPFADRAVAAALLVLLAPVLAAVAVGNLLVFRSPARVLFRQRRVGLNGQVFRILKFRTMREVVSEDDVDLIVTGFGRLLRNTHLDELPQLWNVLRGEMALIGPRPEMVEIESWAAHHVPGFSCRLAIKPGMTGLAQITQGYTPMDVDAYARKLELNLDYLDRASFGTDCRILARTAWWVVTARVAHTPGAPWKRTRPHWKP